MITVRTFDYTGEQSYSYVENAIVCSKKMLVICGAGVTTAAGLPVSASFSIPYVSLAESNRFNYLI